MKHYLRLTAEARPFQEACNEYHHTQKIQGVCGSTERNVKYAMIHCNIQQN